MESIQIKAAALWRKLNKAQWLRHGVQFVSFLLFPGLFLTVFNALRDVVTALVTGTFALSALSGSLITLVAVVGVTALWGRFFCGYLCTFGALQELLAFAGRKLLPGLKKVPEKADKALKYVKYGVLLAVVLLIWTLQLPVDSTLSPWAPCSRPSPPGGCSASGVWRAPAPAARAAPGPAPWVSPSMRTAASAPASASTA